METSYVMEVDGAYWITDQRSSTMAKVFASVFVTAFLSCGILAQRTDATATSCEGLAQLALPEAKITSAQTVAAGAFSPPTNVTPWLAGDASFYKLLPAFCRVTVEARPSDDSHIKIEVWMPISGWNGKFQGQGNGGFAGEIGYHLIGLAIGQGYAAAGTDTGHSGSGIDAKWALGHPEKVIDFGYRGIHVMTKIAKVTTAAFYGKKPRYSYFAGCSNGGRQALMEAQRFPEDYDGILAGAPANFWTHLLASAVWNAQATTLDQASYIPSGKLPAIAGAVNDACDPEDGVSDGILNDPRQCHFDPRALLCKEGDSDKCLTAAQVAALKKLYEGARDSRGGKIFPGLLPGAEEGRGGWALWITGQTSGQSLLFSFGNGYFSNMVYDKNDWDYREVNLDQATKAADDKTAQTLNAIDPNLKPFKALGGKLILYHGWNDPAISALNTIDYYNSVVNTMGQQAADAFVRLFMVPGVQHCGDGPGPDSFGQPGTSTAKDSQHNIQLALEHWVEKGAAPSMIIATKYVNDDPTKGIRMTRPLCPYPQSGKYNGIGDKNDAGSFACGPRIN
jgi:hypothetical protein